MKDEFESNLSQMQKDEAQAAADYVELKKAKMAEIAAGKAKLKEKTFGLADSDDFLATAKEDLAMTREVRNTSSFPSSKKITENRVISFPLPVGHILGCLLVVFFLSFSSDSKLSP